MKSWPLKSWPLKSRIVSYGDAAFRLGLERLMHSAAAFGLDERRAWDRASLTRTAFYTRHKTILDRPRGAGYWLWKPFIIKDALRAMSSGDLLVYADAGIEITASLQPLFDICAEGAGLMLFAGHYDDVGGPGPNVCAKWTKRDCFVRMGCDTPRYYEAGMLDASFVVVRKRPDTVALVDEWLRWCCRRGLVTDDDNVCGRPNLPGFIEHRHDQSILSLLAARERLEHFRHPSQYGNHLKREADRVPGEWLRTAAYEPADIYENSPYGTLLNHHRGELGQPGLRVHIQRQLPAAADRVFRAWMTPAALSHWRAAGRAIVGAEADVRVGGRYELTLAVLPIGQRVPLRGRYLHVEPPTRLVYSWPWRTQVTVSLHEGPGGTIADLTHDGFPSEQLREYHAIGWQAFLDRLDADLRDDCAIPSNR